MPANKLDHIAAFLRTAAFYLVALALLIWAGMDVYKRYQFYQNDNVSRQTQPAEKNAARQLTITNTKTVAGQYLFGRPATQVKLETVTRAPATKLNLRLIGVIATAGEHASKVIIQIDDSMVDVFSIGDRLPKGNATIERIETTQVLLRRNGKLESLAIIRPELEDVSLDEGPETKD